MRLGGFDTGLRVAEDYELYLRIARDYPICCHPRWSLNTGCTEANVSHNSELMLTMTLRVLKSQARYIRSDPRRLFAFLEGIRYLAKTVWPPACIGTGTFLFHFAARIICDASFCS